MTNRPRMIPPNREPTVIRVGRAFYVSPDGRDMPVDAHAVADLEAAGWTRAEMHALPKLALPTAKRAEASAASN